MYEVDQACFIDNPKRIKEMLEEEKDAKSFGISIEALRQQRRECKQLLTGPYAGCTSDFAKMMEYIKSVGSIIREYRKES